MTSFEAGPALGSFGEEMELTAFGADPPAGMAPGIFRNAAAAAQPVVGSIWLAIAAAAAARTPATKSAEGVGAHSCASTGTISVAGETRVSSTLRSIRH